MGSLTFSRHSSYIIHIGSQGACWLWCATLLPCTSRWCVLLIRARSPRMWHGCVLLIEFIKCGSALIKQLVPKDEFYCSWVMMKCFTFNTKSTGDVIKGILSVLYRMRKENNHGCNSELSLSWRHHTSKVITFSSNQATVITLRGCQMGKVCVPYKIPISCGITL